MRSLTDRTLNGFLWSLSGAGMQTVLKIGVLAVLARLLTPADFGVVGAAAMVLSLIAIFSQLGVGPTVVQKADLESVHIRTATTFSTCLGLGVGVVVFLLSGRIASIFRIDGVEAVVALFALSFPIKGLSAVAEALLQREMRFKQLAALTMVSYVLGYAAVAVGLASLGWGVMALVYGQLAQTLLLAAGQLFLTRKSFGLAMSLSALRELLHFGGGFSLARIGNYVALNADNFIVVRWLGVEALGIYGRAYQFLIQPTNLLGTIVDSVLFPAMASVQHDRKKLASAYRLTVALAAMTTLPLSAVLVVLAPEIVNVLLGAKWTAVTVPFEILAASLVFRVGHKSNAVMARATGAVYQNAWRQWLYAVLVSAGAWIGHFAGVEGVAIGCATAIAIQFAVMLEFGRKLTGVALADLVRIHIRHLAVALLVGAVVLAFKMGMASVAHVPDVAVLLCGCLLAALVIGVTLWRAPQLFGDEGQWVLLRMRKRLAATKWSRSFA